MLKAVMMVCWQRPDRRNPVILHSDRGKRFTSADYQQCLTDHYIISSMRAVGHCGDNAAMEGFIGLLNRERVNRRSYLTLADARSDVFDYIECLHNPRMQRRLDAQDQAFRLLTHLSVEMGVEPRFAMPASAIAQRPICYSIHAVTLVLCFAYFGRIRPSKPRGGSHAQKSTPWSSWIVSLDPSAYSATRSLA